MVYEKRSLELSDKGRTHTDNTQAKAGLLFNLPALILNHARQRERLGTEKQAVRRSVLQRGTIPSALKSIRAEVDQPPFPSPLSPSLTSVSYQVSVLLQTSSCDRRN